MITDNSTGEPTVTEGAAPEPTKGSVEDRLLRAMGLDDDEGTPTAPKKPEPTGSKTDDDTDSNEQVAAGDDGADEADAAPAQENDNENTPTLFTVKVAGKEEQVTLEELRAGYSRQKDYTQKTSAVAEERRALAAEQEAVKQERALYAQTLDRLRQKAEQDMQEPDWDTLRATDPIEYGVQFAEYSRKREKLAAIQAEQARLAGIAQKERADALTQRVETERERLFAAMPGWTDAERAKREGEAIRAYGKASGFTDEELDQTYDHRAVVVMNKARLWDELQARKAKALTPAPRPNAPKTAPAGSAPKASNTAKKEYDNRRSALRKSGKVDDAARALEMILSD